MRVRGILACFLAVLMLVGSIARPLTAIAGRDRRSSKVFHRANTLQPDIPTRFDEDALEVALEYLAGKSI